MLHDQDTLSSLNVANSEQILEFYQQKDKGSSSHRTLESEGTI